MSASVIDSVKIKAKLLQKAKSRAGKEIQLKEAFEILARSAGFESWREWRDVLTEHEPFLSPVASSHWHVWYSSYEQACNDLPKHGGYLLPYQRHFFICDHHYLSSIGIDAADPDLIKVGCNWVQPKDLEAYHRLRKKILQRSS